MAYKLIDEQYNPFPNSERKEFICDNDADFTDLPKSAPGSSAVSVETGAVMMVNASGEWAKFGG